MSGFGLVAGVIATFFILGIMTGVFAVMALSAVRDDRKHAARPSDWDGQWGWEEPLKPDDGDGDGDGDGDDGPPRWPGYRGLLASIGG